MKKWKTILALILIFLALILKWNWVWIALLLFGLIQVFNTNEIYFIEVVKKNETPILYYIMLVFWSILTFFSIYNYLFF